MLESAERGSPDDSIFACEKEVASDVKFDRDLM